MEILTDTHAHTVASTHAYSTVHDYWRAAQERGLQLFAITDHAASMPDGAHPWHFGNMKVLPRIHGGVAMLRGIEANILPEAARVDIPDAMVPYLDIAIASFHEPVFSPSDKKTHTDAAIAAIASGKIQILGHPGNPNFPIDYDEVIRAAKDHNVLIEINNSSFHLSRKGSAHNCLTILELVDTLDWQVVFASDSHSAFTLGDVHHCVAKARSIDFPEHRVVSRHAKHLLDFLRAHDKAVAEELKTWVAGLTEA